MKIFAVYLAVNALFVVASCATINFHAAAKLKSTLRGAKQKQSLVEAFQKRTRQKQIALAMEECGITQQTTSTSRRGQNCPASCPLYVQDKTDNLPHCSFRCVPDTVAACKALDPMAPVPDRKEGVCRECQVSGCRDCATDGTDTCIKCKKGMTMSNGKCIDYRKYIWYAIFVVVGLLVVFIALWMWSLSKRASMIDNQAGLQRGLGARSAAKLHMPIDDRPDKVWLRSGGGKFVTATEGDRPIFANGDFTSSEKFKFKYHTGKDGVQTVSLKSSHGKYVTAGENKRLLANGGSMSAMRFIMTTHDDGNGGTTSLKTEDGEYLSEGKDGEVLLSTSEEAELEVILEDVERAAELWPITTNLLTTPVAGNGVLHLFNFQFMIIVWAVVVVTAWTILAYAVDTDFFRLGTRSPGRTPRDNCIIIAWGFETQQRLMYAKYMFVGCVYVGSFLGAIFYGITQLRAHQRLDAGRISHKDYCAKCTGFPRFGGKEKVEDLLREKMESACGQKVLGVSICWDFTGKEDTVMKVIEYDLEERLNCDHLVERRASQSAHMGNCEEMSTLDAFFTKWESCVLDPDVQKIVKKQHSTAAMNTSSMRLHSGAQPGEAADPEAAVAEVDVVEELEQLYSTDDAFIVFHSEAARDAAIKTVTDMGGVDFQDSKLQLEMVECEPQTVNWPKITNRTWLASIMRIVVGFLCIVLALAVWCFAFYLPYARSVAKTDYAHGRDPDPLTKTMFGLIVVAGNALMYIVCAEVSDRIGFKTQAKREVCYMLTYCFACVFNVLLDLVMAYHQSYKMMVGLGVHTHDGTPLSDVDTFAARFDTYAMQKSLGQILLDYSFPATFLIPFLVEPFVVVIGPYLLMSMIVRSNSSIIGSSAEAYLSSSPMDLSRYADVMLNLMLAVLMFFFPGGFCFKILVGLIISHMFIYAYDHSRVISSVPACDFATMSVEWWAQWMLSIPCGLLLACAFFKANCDEDAVHCWEDTTLMYRCFGLLIGHVYMHTLVLMYIVPLFGNEMEAPTEPYQKCAQLYPCSWFSANPVHCLRSKYIYAHDPPCDYFVSGKEHMMRKNKLLHLYFHSKAPMKEEFGVQGAFKLASEKARSATNTVLKDLKELKEKGLRTQAREETPRSLDEDELPTERSKQSDLSASSPP